MKQIYICLAALLASLSHAQADPSQPFATTNLNPFVQVHGLPITRGGATLEEGTTSWQLRADVASHFTTSTSGIEGILIDGETQQLSLSLIHGMTDRLEIGIDVPYIRHTGGSLDQFIETWHSVFGLPQGGRKDAPQDRLAFQYQGLSAINVASRASGLGDATLHAGYQLRQTDDSVLTIRGGIKLPTGDADKLTGSEAMGIFAALHLDSEELFGTESLSFNGSLGVLNPGDGEILDHQQNDWIGYGSANLAWRLGQRISLKSQIDIHSAFYDSNLRELGDATAILTVGGSIMFGESMQLDLSLSEDILTDRSPDVVFQIALSSRF